MKALVCIDFINEIMDERGKLAGKGYPAFAHAHGTVGKVAAAQQRFREAGAPVVHVHVGFSPNYIEHPAGSPLFGKAKQFGALQLGAFGTEFVPTIAPRSNEPVVTKHRISAFYGTGLELILRARGITEVVLAGVATDLAVESAARDAHDRDFAVTVLSDCCAAATDEDHEKSLLTLRKIANVTTAAEVEI